MQGFLTNDIQDFELSHSKVSLEAAKEAIVLLKNDNHLLPIKPQPIAYYGHEIQIGGSGSGEVNHRGHTELPTVLEAHGFILTTKDILNEYTSRMDFHRQERKRKFWEEFDQLDESVDYGNRFFLAYEKSKFPEPSISILPKDTVDTCVYMISRKSGEGNDRTLTSGDYYLSNEENEALQIANATYKHIILLLNVGGIIDMSFVANYPHIEAILLVSQLGQCASEAIVQTLIGGVTPSGKLTDTWASSFSDYPAQPTKELTVSYTEGTFVGYRYFDSFRVSPQYPFGYGLSYTTFQIKYLGTSYSSSSITFQFRVLNTGEYAGKEVIQLYAHGLDAKENEPFKSLVAFKKTILLEPHTSTELSITIPYSRFYSYRKGNSVLLEKYVIYYGNDSQMVTPFITIDFKRERVIRKLPEVMPLMTPLEELQCVHKPIDITDVSVIAIDTDIVLDELYSLNSSSVSHLTRSQKEKLVVGASALQVPGSAGETSNDGVKPLILADGPAGLRITNKFYLRDGKPLPTTMEQNMDHGVLDRSKPSDDLEVCYQYCTAFPIGTALAQTWNEELVEKVGKAIGEEMQVFHVDLILGPGMNIHRTPLCGRNFEYYSEDPLLTGRMASAYVKGVQMVPHCGATLKHFAANNQEFERFHYDALISQKALYDIYLKGFEVAIKEANPVAIMTSYNKINHIHSANNIDLCTTLARNLWGFDGLIMTDWTTTWQDDVSSRKCIEVGNDLIMPGNEDDLKDVQNVDDTLLDACVSHILRVIERLS